MQARFVIIILQKRMDTERCTVMYASYDSIRATLDYDFSQEKEFSYNGLSIEESVHHIAKFTS